MHEPYSSTRHPVPINATIVHAATLLHPALPQPDGGMIYRCLTEFPGRTLGCVVPLSTLTFKLDGGQLWPHIGDWERVVARRIAVSRKGACDAVPLGLPGGTAALLTNGPHTQITVFQQDGTAHLLGGRDRQQRLEELAASVHDFAVRAGFWPGNDLVAPPSPPARVPYQPFRYP
ncbi:MAG: hypothetical protein GEU94_08580 [Micromonosporaceae bacterium]|nr:hypothetical protein [Micromonosporaceae bacterium]